MKEVTTAALDYITSSKSLILVLMLVVLGMFVFIFATVILLVFGERTPFDYLAEFYQLEIAGGGAGVTRNIISDGVMPRIPQAVGAAKDPQVAIQPPVSMAHANQITPLDLDAPTIRNVQEHQE